MVLWVGDFEMILKTDHDRYVVDIDLENHSIAEQVLRAAILYTSERPLTRHRTELNTCKHN